MAAPSIRSQGTPLSDSTATPTFDEPAGADDSDVIAVFWFQDDGRTSVDTPPAGFAAPEGAPQNNDPAQGPTRHSLNVYLGRRADVGAGPYAFTVLPGAGTATPYCEGRAIAIQDCTLDTTILDDADGATTGDAPATTAPLVSADSSGTDRLALYAATNWSGGAWTEPVGYTSIWAGVFGVISLYTAEMPAAATTSPQAGNAADALMNAWVGILLPVDDAIPIAVDDNGSAADTLTATAAAAAADTAAGVDAVAVAAQSPLADTASAADTLTITAQTPLADTSAAAEALTAAVTVALADTAAASDVAAAVDDSHVPKSLSDTAAGADRLRVAILRPDTGRTLRPDSGVTERP